MSRARPAAASALLAAVLCAAVAGIAGARQEDTRQPKGSSVGQGAGPAPAIAPAVRQAASRAGCRTRAFRSEGFAHATVGSPPFKQLPPVSGTHAPRWADWGVYEKVVPHKYQVHNLEHGGVVIHLGARMPDAAAKSLGEFYAAEPGYLVITPRVTGQLVPRERGISRFPEAGIVVTSWQRRLVCTRARPAQLNAAVAFARRYRGTGREQVPAFNAGAPRPSDLPAPSLPTEEPQ